MSKFYSKTLNLDFQMSNEDFANYIQSCTDEQREAIVGMAITYSIGSDSYIRYIREVSKDGKLIKLCRNMDDDEIYQDIEDDEDDVWISYNWEHYFLRTRNGNKVYLQRKIRDNYFSYEDAAVVIYKPKYNKKFEEYGSLNFNQAKEKLDPCF
tara:strand:+ start:110 stop:568 length:459 start_codon:yes stop_codon:yes gene_type:complete